MADTITEITTDEAGVTVLAQEFDSLAAGVFRVARMERSRFVAQAFTNESVGTHEAVDIHGAVSVTLSSLTSTGGISLRIRRADGSVVNIGVYADGKELPITLK